MLIDANQSSLARAEIYLTIASLVRNVDLELGECDKGDVEITRDIQISGVRRNSRGLKVTVIGKQPQSPRLRRETLDRRLAA
jgi:hypothetical protein